MSSIASFNSFTKDLPHFDYQALLPEAVKLLAERFGQVAVSHGSINVFLLVNFTPFFELSMWNRQTAIDNLLYNMIKAEHLVYKKELCGSVVIPWKDQAEQSPATIKHVCGSVAILWKDQAEQSPTTMKHEEIVPVKKDSLPEEATLKDEEVNPSPSSSSSSSSSSDQVVTELLPWKTKDGYSASVLEVLKGLKYLKSFKRYCIFFVAFDNIINANVVFSYEENGDNNGSDRLFEERVQLAMIDMRFTDLESIRRISDMKPEFQLYLDCMQYFKETVGYISMLGVCTADKTKFKATMKMLDPQGRCTHLSPGQDYASFVTAKKSGYE